MGSSVAWLEDQQLLRHLLLLLLFVEVQVVVAVAAVLHHQKQELVNLYPSRRNRPHL